MSIDASNFVDAALTEQARRNAAFQDQPDVNDLINDFTSPDSLETIGMQGDTIGVSTTSTAATHKWDDGQTAWGFWSWDT